MEFCNQDILKTITTKNFKFRQLIDDVELITW